MKKQVIQILAIASLLSATVAAQSPPPSPGDISVFVPFEFRAGDSVLPRGGYTIYQEASGLRLCGDELNCVGVSAMALVNDPTSGQARLAFHRYANQNISSKSGWYKLHTSSFRYTRNPVR